MSRLTSDKYIYVLSASGQPLMPTTRQGHVRRLLNAGKARITSHVPFVIQLEYDPGDGTQLLHGGTDPGRTNIGEAVLNNKGEVVFKAHVTTRNKDIPKLMSDRRQHRQASRRGERLARKRLAKQLGTTFKGLMERILPGCDRPVKLKDIINTEARFNNRKRPAGWLTPTAAQLVRTHLNMVRKICSILPVTDWTLEINKFAFMKLDDGSVRGIDFQNGRLKNYDSVKDYIYAMQNGRCACCGRPIEHFHHIVPRSKGGSDVPENIVGLCKDCHDKIHKGDKDTRARLDKAGLKKKYNALSVLNQAIPYILDGLTDMFGSENVHGCYGFQTQGYRSTHDIGKDHPEDAVCIAAIGCGLNTVTDGLTAYEVQQFRRHDRQIVKAQRERTYKLDGVTVAKNRTPRFEQPKDMPALSVWYRNEVFAKGKTAADAELSRLTVTKSKRYYNDPHRLLPGARFMYQGKVYILYGNSNGGKRFMNKDIPPKGYVSRSACKVLKHNSGLVYIPMSIT